MYGWLVLLVSLLFSCCCIYTTATGSILKEYGQQEDVRGSSSSAAVMSTTTHVCTEDASTRTVSCRPSREESGISMCCSLTWSTTTSAQFRPTPPCTSSAADKITNNHNTTRHSTPTNCTLTIPASSSSNRRKRSLVSYELLTCLGSTLEVRCRVNLSCSDRGVAWRRAGDEFTLQGRDLRIQDVQGRDSGTYHCEVTDYSGKTRLGAVVVVVAQFEPTLTIPKPRWARPLECISEASPPATITWYKDDVPLLPVHHDLPVWYIVSTETDECRTKSRLRLLPSPSLDENSTDVTQEAANFTCVAVNRHGQSAATLLLPVSPDEPSGALPADFKRRFNVTGFIVGMLPPLFISFYIIVKLGYRSRYAEERGEDDGFREEPFFISY